jgi:hypothetical protein
MLGIQYLSLLHGNNGYANASQLYIINTLPVLLRDNGVCQIRQLALAVFE